MQMTGQQRIPAPNTRVWEALYDPEVLRRCIPGCQSLTKESDERMLAAADIRIGPIGARFTGTVTLSNIDPPRGCSMTIEGRGGTVGFVKSGAKVRLADDGSGGTLLSYEVEAEVGGRLAQLGGPLIDAAARQLAGKFFQQFAAVMGRTAEEPAKPLLAMAERSEAPAAPAARAPATPASASRGGPSAWILAVALAALIGYLVGHAGRGGAADWLGLAIGLLLLIVGAVCFELGRRAAAPVVTLDASVLARLIEEAER